MKITIGCDPELFVKKDGKFRCAHNLVPGTKENPFPVKHGAVQVDGFALEYNIDPVDNADDFVKYNQAVMQQMKDMVPEYEFAIVPTARFNGAHFKAQPAEAKELGCTPDYNAYTLRENEKPDNNTTMRTAAGHIHIGFIENADVRSDEHMIRCATLVKQLDCYLGLPSILYDKDFQRRAMYGAAGAFRPKEYGVEYRVLSNAWLLSEQRMRFVFDMTILAVNDLMAGTRPFEKIREDTVKYNIDNSDQWATRALIQNHMPNGKALAAKADAL